jgi:hypothetical protein
MPRIRTIKPDFWSDEKIVELTPLARLLFIGLWNFSDDFGNSEASRAQVKMRIFPADTIDVEPLIEELKTFELISEYIVERKNYFNIRNFTKHQFINRPSKTKAYPPPPANTLHEPSMSPPEKYFGKGSGSGRERKGKDLKDLPQPVDNSVPPVTTGANDGGNAEGHPPVAPTPLSVDPEVIKLGEVIKRRQAEGIPH